MNHFNPCIIIPCYNHGESLETVITQLQYLGLPIIVIDDGSNATTKTLITQAVDHTKNIQLITLTTNQGKGGAIIAGLSSLLALPETGTESSTITPSMFIAVIFLLAGFIYAFA